jgi:hypothetical protein
LSQEFEKAQYTYKYTVYRAVLKAVCFFVVVKEKKALNEYEKNR